MSTEALAHLTVAEVDVAVQRWLELKQHQEQTTAEMASITNRLRTLGIGKFQTSYGVPVIVSPPARSFDVDKALALLRLRPDWDQVALRCVATGWDTSKLRAELSQAQLDLAMAPGSGSPRVSIR